MRVDPVGEIGVGRKRAGADAGYRHEGHQRPVAGEQRDEGDDHAAQVQVQEQQRREQIAEPDALQHAEIADVGPMMADAAVIDQPEAVQQQCPPQHAQMRLRQPFPLHQPRQREHDGDAGDENEQREDEIVEREAFPGDVVQLLAEEFADAADDRPLVGGHVVERPDGAVAAENPEDVEAAQRVDRGDAPRRGNRRNIDETAWRQL